MKQLTETNTALADVRKAQKAVEFHQQRLVQKHDAHFDITMKVGAGLGHFSDEWPNQIVRHDVLDGFLTARFRANYAQSLAEAARDLRAEERRLCEELVRLAAKTAAAGL